MMENDPNNATAGRDDEALRESEERHRMLLEMSPDAVYVSEQRLIVEANAAAAALFGVTGPDQLRGRDLYEFAHPDSRGTVERRGAALYGGESEAPVAEEKLVRPDGRVIEVEVKSRSFRHHGRLLVQSIARDITERKRVERELAQRQREMATLLDNLPAGVFLKDGGGRYLMANRNFCEVVGCRREELAGKTDRDIYSPETTERFRAAEAAALAGDRPHRLGESEVVQADQKLTLESWLVPVRDERGKNAGLIGIFYNVTERKRAEQQVRLVSQQWQVTFDAINDGIALLDAAGTVQRCNAALAGLLGRPCGEIVGQQSCALLPALDADGGCDFMESLRQQRRRISREVHDGARWLSLTFDPIFGDDGALSGSVFILKDVTQVRQAEERTKLMVEAVEQMEEGVMIYDTADRMIYVNPALERITGFSQEELLGRSNAVPPQMLTPEFQDYWKKVWEAVAAEGVWRGSKSSLRKDGTVYEQELVASVVRDHEDEPISYLVVVRDVTETRRLQAIAEIASNINNIGFIFSGVRHELGNPVNAIKTTTSVLRQEYRGLDDGARLELVDRVIADVGRLESLLKVLHSFSMFENLSLEDVELAAFFRDLMPAVEPDFRRARIEFSYDFPAGGCTVVADRRALYQVAVNLLTNAFAALEGRERPAIAIRAVPGGQHHRLVIADNGGGMSEEVRRNVFKPFYTTKAGGTGLGMVICQKLAMAMDGQIEIESASGTGTTVTVHLPAAGRARPA